ncbi:MAG TPA: sodium:solute symporter family protein [Chlamydiales bacterium]|nr:sodium:solute symporter family protein [Chlamydiales bacterium]
MNITLFIVILFGLQLFYWLVGRRASKNVTGKEDYFLAGRNVRLFPLLMTFFATQVGGGIVLGSAEEAYRFGWSVMFYPLGAALGLMLLGAGVGRKLAEFPVTTVAQILEVVYKSSLLKKAASLLSIISLFMVLVAQIIASQKFLVSMGFTNTALFTLFWGVVIIYTAQGGLKAVISTDIVQAGVFTVVLLGAFSLSQGSMPEALNFAATTSKLTGWLLMPLLFMVIEQDMGQRCFAGASPKIVSRATLLAGIATLIVGAIPVFFGVYAKSIGLVVPKGSSILMAAVANSCPPWMVAFVGCAVLAAIISTATSLINAISSNLSNDFKIASTSMRRIRWVTCIIACAAIFFAFFFDNVVDVLIQSYDLSVSCLFIPIVFAFFKKKGNFIAATLSLLFGAIGFVMFRVFPIDFPKEVASILLSLLGFGLGSLISRIAYVPAK